MDFGSRRNSLVGALPAGVPQFRQPVALPGGLNRQSRRAAAAQHRRTTVVTPSADGVEAKIRAFARDHKFIIEVVCGSWRGEFVLAPEAGEKHLAESLEAVEALRPMPELTETERELMAESMAAVAPNVIPPAAGNPFKLPPLTAGEIECPGDGVDEHAQPRRAHYTLATDTLVEFAD